MKCPRCSAPSEVAETRAYLGAFVRRGRLCFNGHRFTTYEVHAGNLDRRTLPKTARRIKDAAASWSLKRKVWAAPASVPSTRLAESLGVSDTRVRQIRAEGRAANDEQVRHVRSA